MRLALRKRKNLVTEDLRNNTLIVLSIIWGKKGDGMDFDTDQNEINLTCDCVKRNLQASIRTHFGLLCDFCRMWAPTERDLLHIGSYSCERLSLSETMSNNKLIFS